LCCAGLRRTRVDATRTRGTKRGYDNDERGWVNPFVALFAQFCTSYGGCKYAFWRQVLNLNVARGTPVWKLIENVMSRAKK
jgi:hypothetical protein